MTILGGVGEKCACDGVGLRACMDVGIRGRPAHAKVERDEEAGVVTITCDDEDGVTTAQVYDGEKYTLDRSGDYILLVRQDDGGVDGQVEVPRVDVGPIPQDDIDALFDE